ncbi:FAD-containing oxidoreductase [Aquamicrobium sp. LC103]|uniref:FAD-containing oxidoreductase n=1 Tax=Aquamicrobium sp. LC103 TaxID=1120658 RepID=UPI00063EC153|nr:FAD-containing oxidoreductase [Aquamicrobium sp. LC103]TKT75069.1 FAD-containing oxidoreductase [Aquamicrobium sp. LC103]
MTASYDAIVVGAGQAGPSLAVRLAQAGMKTAIVERKLVGGTCVNTGCTPTKTMVASAYVAHMARRAADYGVKIAAQVDVDMAAVKTRADGVAARSRGNLEDWLGGTDNCTLIRGHARFASPAELVVGDTRLTAPRIFLNVGGRAFIPDYPGIDRIDYLTNSSILRLDTVPRHLVVVGGGYVGLEFAQMFRRFGSEVTIVERGDRLIKREDEDISSAIREILETEGIRLRLGADCIAFAPHEEGVAVKVDCREGSPEVIGSHVLLAIGRRPNTDDLELDKAGVATDKHGYVETNEELRTNVPGIWALGDCNGRGAFTHTSYNDYEIVAENLLDGAARKVSDRHPAYALYIDPPLGRAGMTEAEARETGREILVGMRPMTRVSRAVEKGEAQGLMKVVVDTASERLLGAAILGVGGDEAVHSVLDMIYADVPFKALKHAVHIHPTVAELIPTLLGELKPG